LVGLFTAIGIVTLPLNNSTFAEDRVTPFQHALTTPQGTLKSPYEGPTGVTEEGLSNYRSLDCSGCHGGTGGGGMAAPLTNEVWIYGNDDDTLVRIISLGTGSLSLGNAFLSQG
jgi:mono/diheme cytochrome c family protein